MSASISKSLFENPIVGAVTGIVNAILLGGLLLLINVFQALTIVVRPFSHYAFRRINRMAAHCWWGLCVLVGERLLGVEIVFTGDSLPMRENAIVIANHQEMPDIFVIMSIGLRKGRLGDLKWMVKQIIRYVPGIGWGLLFLDSIFLKRNWADDRRLIHTKFDKFNREVIPYWLTLFPEGTRIRPHKLAKSQNYAKKRGAPIPENVMLPRPRGFMAAVANLRPSAGAVYDLTIGYEGKTPTIWDLLRVRMRRAHLHIRRFPIAELPQEEEAISEWLHARFREKDEFLAEFKRVGHFPGTVLKEPL